MDDWTWPPPLPQKISTAVSIFFPLLRSSCFEVNYYFSIQDKNSDTSILGLLHNFWDFSKNILRGFSQIPYTAILKSNTSSDCCHPFWNFELINKQTCITVLQWFWYVQLLVMIGLNLTYALNSHKLDLDITIMKLKEGWTTELTQNIWPNAVPQASDTNHSLIFGHKSLATMTADART